MRKYFSLNDALYIDFSFFFLLEHESSGHRSFNIICLKQFYEELVDGDDAELRVEHTELPKKPSNKIIKFASDSSGSDNDDDDDDKDGNKDDAKVNNLETGDDKDQNAVASTDNGNDELRLEAENVVPSENQALTEEKKPEKQDIKESETPENQDVKEAEALGPPAKRQCTDADAASNGTFSKKVETISVDKLIEAELAELGDKSKVSQDYTLLLFNLHLNAADFLLIYVPEM